MPIPNKRVVIDLFNVFASDEEINVLAAWVRCSNNIVSTVAAIAWEPSIWSSSSVSKSVFSLYDELRRS